MFLMSSMRALRIEGRDSQLDVERPARLVAESLFALGEAST